MVRKLSFSLRFLLIFASAASVVFAFCFKVISPPFSRTGYYLLEVGISDKEVVQLLGQPSKSEAGFWTYDGQGKTGWLVLRFDENNRLIGADVESIWTELFGKNQHLFDVLQ